MNKKILDRHKALNEVKGTERKFLIIDPTHMDVVDYKKDKETFLIHNCYSVNWIAEDVFTVTKVEEELLIEKFKKLAFGTPTSELRAEETKWRKLLLGAIEKEYYVYIAYYIGNDKEVIVAEVDKLTEAAYFSIISK